MELHIVGQSFNVLIAHNIKQNWVTPSNISKITIQMHINSLVWVNATYMQFDWS